LTLDWEVSACVIWSLSLKKSDLDIESLKDDRPIPNRSFASNLVEKTIAVPNEQPSFLGFKHDWESDCST